MPTYDVTRKPDRLITPEMCEKYEPIQKLKLTMKPNVWKSTLKFVDEVVATIQPSKQSNLTYTRTGVLFGHSSQQNKMKVDRLWERVIGVVGDGPECLITVGALLRWRITLDGKNTWLMWVETTDDIDDKTGNKIKISHYWIDNNFSPVKRATAQDLADKFNSRFS